MKLLEKMYNAYIEYAKEEINFMIYNYYLDDDFVKIKLKDKIKIKIFRFNKDLYNFMKLNYNMTFDFSTSSSLYNVVFS